MTVGTYFPWFISIIRILKIQQEMTFYCAHPSWLFFIFFHRIQEMALGKVPLYFSLYLSMSSLYFFILNSDISLHNYFWVNEQMARWMDGGQSFLFCDSYCLNSNLVPQFTFRVIRNFLSPRKSLFFLITYFSFSVCICC